MNKLMSIFGAIVFASFIMTSCGGASPEASGDAAASGDAGTEVKTDGPATQETMAVEAPASSEVKAPEVKAADAPAASADAKKTKK